MTLVERLHDLAATPQRRRSEDECDEVFIEAARRIAELEAENADLKCSVIAFGALWSVEYAKLHGLPDGHIAAEHYDILDRAGARMVNFTRAALNHGEAK